ncbi:hypothetical protein ACV3UL_07405 [Clostridium perfringens]
MSNLIDLITNLGNNNASNIINQKDVKSFSSTSKFEEILLSKNYDNENKDPSSLKYFEEQDDVDSYEKDIDSAIIINEDEFKDIIIPLYYVLNEIKNIIEDNKSGNIQDVLYEIKALINDDLESLIGDLDITKSELFESMYFSNQNTIDSSNENFNLQLFNKISLANNTIIHPKVQIKHDSTLDNLTDFDEQLTPNNILDNLTDSIKTSTKDLFGGLDNISSEKFTSDTINTILDKIKNILNKSYIDKKEDILNVPANLDIGLQFTQLKNEQPNITGSNPNIHPIAQQILSNIESQLNSNFLTEKTLQIRLKLFPARLGGISVDIERIEESIAVKIISENSDVARVIANSLKELQVQLSDRVGYSVNIDLFSNDGQNGTKRNNRRDSSESDKSLDIKDSESSRVINIDSEINLINKILDIKV